MQDDHLLPALEAQLDDPAIIETFRRHSISTYSDLFTALRRKNIDPGLQKAGFEALFLLHRAVDKRRAVPILLTALISTDERIRSEAIRTLGRMDSRRAVPQLMEILADRAQTLELRMDAIDALWSISDERAVPLFKYIVNDSTENVVVRSFALEWFFEKPDPINDYIRLLSDPETDIRFWAAYRLTQTFTDISTALSELDRVVASDHTLPKGWGWHIDREAMLPLEKIYHRVITQQQPDENGEYCSPSMYLISPAPEYSTIQYRYRKWGKEWTYATDPLPTIHLGIAATWLAEQLQAKWPEIRLNVRQPRPQAYLLDWHLQVGEKNLIGGLHRDQYGVVLCGDEDLVMVFVEWYRTLFPAQQRLYLYEWADAHVELKPGMTAEEIMQASNRSSMSAVEVMAEDLTFG